MKKIIIAASIVILIMLTVLIAVLLADEEEDNITILNSNSGQIVSYLETEDEIIINFEACDPMLKRVGVAFGSTTFEIKEKKGDFCVMSYGSEIENPDWDGVLDTRCEIPVSLGEQRFSKNDLGIDFGALGNYCAKIE